MITRTFFLIKRFETINTEIDFWATINYKMRMIQVVNGYNEMNSKKGLEINYKKRSQQSMLRTNQRVVP